MNFTELFTIFTLNLAKPCNPKKGDCFIFDGGNRPEYFKSVKTAFLTHLIYISAQTGKFKKAVLIGLENYKKSRNIISSIKNQYPIKLQVFQTQTEKSCHPKKGRLFYF